MIIDKEVKEKLYVSPKVFRKQLEEYYKSDIMTNTLAENIVKIAEGLSYNWRFLNYSKSWKEDMVGDAVVKMYSALESKKFMLEMENSNPFSYFNQIAWNAFSNRIKKEKRQHEGLEQYKQMLYEEGMNESSDGSVYVKPMLEYDDEDSYYE